MMGKSAVQIKCDNQQTLRLINDGIAELRTKLRHVDIHNFWLRLTRLKNLNTSSEKVLTEMSSLPTNVRTETKRKIL